MNFVIQAFLGALAQILPSLIGRVMSTIGISFVTYKGLSALLGFGEDLIVQKMHGLPADAVQFFAWMNLDKGMTMIFSAMATSLILRGIIGGVSGRAITTTAAR